MCFASSACVGYSFLARANGSREGLCKLKTAVRQKLALDDVHMFSAWLTGPFPLQDLGGTDWDWVGGIEEERNESTTTSTSSSTTTTAPVQAAVAEAEAEAERPKDPEPIKVAWGAVIGKEQR